MSLRRQMRYGKVRQGRAVMVQLILAALFWLVSHFGLAAPAARAPLVAKLTENGFRALYSIVSLVALVLLILAWRHAPEIPLWQPPLLLWPLFLLLMLAACILLIGAFSRANPTAPGPIKPDYAVRGMQRITRHPGLWAFALWAVVHLLANGNLSAVIFFATFLATALIGMVAIDHKLAARNPTLAAKLRAETSIVPFAAIATGRNHIVLSEIGLIPTLGGLVLFLVLLFLHHSVIGVSPLP